MWNELDSKGKQPYESLSLQDKSRYDREMEEFDKNGYFTNQEGVCSSTLKPKKPKMKKGMVEVI